MEYFLAWIGGVLGGATAYTFLNYSLMRAWRKLENDFGDLQDRVVTTLGRVSRLKALGQLPDAVPIGGPRKPPPPQPEPNQPLRRDDLVFEARQKGLV